MKKTYTGKVFAKFDDDTVRLIEKMTFETEAEALEWVRKGMDFGKLNLDQLNPNPEMMLGGVVENIIDDEIEDTVPGTRRNN